MTFRYLRVFKKVDIDDIREHLMIYGTLAGNCSKCNCMSIKLEATQCPECNAEFRYIAFRNLSENFPKIQKLIESRPGLIIIDYEDYRKISGAIKAQGIFGD